MRSLGLLALFTVVAACSGDNRPYVAPPTEPLPGKPDYTKPEGFGRRDCVAGSMAGIAVPGIYNGRYEADQFAAQFSMRVDPNGADGLRVEQNGRSAHTVLATADYFFTLRDNGGYQTAIFFCRVDSDGAMRGQIAFIFASEDGDAEDATALLGTIIAKRLTPVGEGVASGLTLLGEFKGANWTDISVNVRVKDGVAYLANYTRGLDIVDVSTPGAPFAIGHAPVQAAGEIYNDVKLYDGPDNRRYAIMGGSRSGAVIYEVTEPSTPTVVAAMGMPRQLGDGVEIHTLFVDGDRAYLANTQRGLEIYDLTDPTAPVKLGEFRAPTSNHYLHDLYVEGDRAYLNYWNTGMVIVDVSNPSEPLATGTFADYGEDTNHSCWVTTVGDRRIAITGDEQYGAHAYLVDVTEATPGFLQVVSEWQTRPEVSIHNIMAFGPLVFISHYQDGIRVLDISTPEMPQEVAWFQTWPGYPMSSGVEFFDGAVGLDYDPEARLVYVADATRGLMILSFDVAPITP